MKINLLLFLHLFISLVSSAAPFQAHRAGSWYPATKDVLLAQLQTMDSDAQHLFDMSADGSRVRALIAPHAGYDYSGAVAAAAYRLLDATQIDRIIILAPSHFVRFSGVALPPFTSYRTPLGILKIDAQAIKDLKKFDKQKTFVSNLEPFFPEHSAEVQLPLIQYYVPHLPIVPLIVGTLSDDTVASVAQILQKIITPHTLVVVSSDFIHYGPNYHYTPFKDHIPLRIRQLDSRILMDIQNQSLQSFTATVQETGATVCGYEPLRILLKLIETGAFGHVITRLVAYDTSTHRTDDDQNIVTYASLITTQETNNATLNQLEKRLLLAYARDTLNQIFKKTVDDPTLLKPIMTKALARPQGAFITLNAFPGGKKTLRGCIGTVQATNSLVATVAAKTVDTAFHDTRFRPVTADEVDALQIEISALGKPYPVNSYRDIVLNKHGIILESDGRSALFLPKVPSEFSFDLSQTLTELSQKAGLGPDAWKKPTTHFMVFEADEWGEPHRAA